MNMRRLSVVTAIILSLGLASGLGQTTAQKKPKPKPFDAKAAQAALDPVYKDFIKLTAYLIHPVEKDVFLKLTSNRDRDVFIESFWKQRDPTPGTPENEYKAEINKRFLYVNQFFSRGTTREGWQTDKGRIYMILGAPVSKEEFRELGVIPCEVWYFYGDSNKQLPPYFGVLFFQKGGVGDFRMYDSFQDGPAALLEQHREDGGATDNFTIYEKIYEINPTLADLSLSMIPGESGSNYYQPSLRNYTLLAAIYESPRKDVNPSYATHFFDYKGMVSTEYMTNMIEAQSLAAVIHDPVLGMPFVHFSLAPQKVSVDYYEPTEQYFCVFKLSVSLRPAGAKEPVLYQFTRDHSLYFTAEEMERVRTNGLAFEETFPVIEGEYTVSLLLQNEQGKEFCIAEKSVRVPAASAPRLDVPLLGYQMSSYPADVHLPFKLGDKKIVVDPKMMFAGQDQVILYLSAINVSPEDWPEAEVQVLLKGQKKATAFQKMAVLRLADFPYRKILPLSQAIPVQTLAPDYYDLKAVLVGAGGKVLDEKTGGFGLVAERAIGHPVAKAKGVSLANKFVFYDIQAQQYDQVGRPAEAEAAWAQAYALNPGYRNGVVNYASFLLKQKKWDRALEVVGSLKGDDKSRFDYFLIRGLAFMNKGDYSAAIGSLQEANKIYNSDTRLLNALGASYVKAGQPEQALIAYQASLKLNEKQDDIRKIVEDLGKSK